MDFNSTELPIGWFRDQYAEGTLRINPPYQRKPVWKARQKCYLIESILMGLPVPEIYVQQRVRSDGKVLYAIVDGQQRMRAILQFIGVETDPDEVEHNRFRLDKLEADSPWTGISFEKLSPEQRKKFIGHRLAVRYLNTDSDDEIREMFRRLNKYLTPLKPQELRNATYSGPFIKLVTKYADDEYWAENRIVTPEAIRRMGDVEFVSELFIGLLHGPQAGSSAEIDEYYAQYEDYEDEIPEQKIVVRLFDDSKTLCAQLFPEIRETRWANKTDYYTLFVAIGGLLRTHKLKSGQIDALQKKLEQFEKDVGRRMADEGVRVTADVVKYVRAVEKGANEKSRRMDRHEVIRAILEPFFQERRR
jgi:hypothetical protein